MPKAFSSFEKWFDEYSDHLRIGKEYNGPIDAQMAEVEFDKGTSAENAANMHFESEYALENA